MWKPQTNVRIISQVYSLLAVFILFYFISQANIKFQFSNVGQEAKFSFINKSQSPSYEVCFEQPDQITFPL